MQIVVIMPINIWKELPGKIANAMYAHSLKEYGFKVVDRESGKEITEHLEDWFTGVIVKVFQEATKDEKG